LLVEAEAPFRNLEELTRLGCLGSMGFYEACDFTPFQATENGAFEVIRCWMAHHQGMSLMALCNFLEQSSIQKWFHREPRVMAAELLLHEKAALSIPLKAHSARAAKKDPTRKLLRSAACSDALAHARGL
jgi:cyclic beta-1,2-glucan synthetase